MIMKQFAPVIEKELEKELVHGLSPEPDNQWYSNKFIYLVLLHKLDRAKEEIFRAIIS